LNLVVEVFHEIRNQKSPPVAGRKEPLMMKKLSKQLGKGKKKRVLGEVAVLRPEEYKGLEVDSKVEMIRALIPLGLMHANELLQQEVTRLAGEPYERVRGGKECVRYGSNRGSVPVGGQRIAIRVPRVRNQRTNQEVALRSLRALREQGGLDELLLRRVLYGISCRNYEAAAECVPGAIGLSSSTVSRQFIEATATKLREFQERDLSEIDLVAIWIDGKTFSEDTLVLALGLTMDGRKVPLGFVQTGTENEKVISSFLRELLDRGLNIDQGILVVVDGSKGLRAAVKKAFKDRAVVQRCQWHKRENVLQYLPKEEQDSMRRRLQRAYERPTYSEARAALEDILEELRERNLSAARSLEEGLEETLALHRLGVFPLLGRSLKTTNCLESLLSQVEARCWKVSCWKNSSQKHRWLAACLLDIEPRLWRIHGYQHLHLLRAALQEELGIKVVKSVA